MKKIFYVMGLCLMAVTCKQAPNRLTLTGTNVSVINDIYVYDLAENKPIDTIKVTGGKFVYTMEITGEPKLMTITDNAALSRFFIAEKGNLTLAGDTGQVMGSPLNDRLAEITETYRNTGKDLEEKKMALLKKAEEEGKDMPEEQVAELQALDKQQADMFAAIGKKYYKEDKGTILGVFELMFLQSFLSEEEFISLYDQGGEIVKKHPSFAKLFEAKANKEKTKAGAKYVDFQGVNPKDMAQVLKLSDFAGKGNYVLLDFWASWCGPCRAAMPDIKRLKDKYSGKGLEVVGIVVGDKIEDHLKAARDMKLTWVQIFDKDNAIIPLYGIEGIPTLILLDKDGTILVRTNEKTDIVEKIRSLLD
jgi:thiol-disulfide isomerase/thioredoxin